MVMKWLVGLSHDSSRSTGLTVRYGSLVALKAMSVDFRPGEVTVLLGRSGTGKSTLLRCLNHLQRPTEGSVSVQGIGCLDAARLRPHPPRDRHDFSACTD